MWLGKKQKDEFCRTDGSFFINGCNMSRIIFFLFILIMALASANSKDLEILPYKAEAGKEIELIYTTDKDPGSVIAVLYLFNENDPMPTAIDLQMKKVNDLYKTKFQIDDETVFLMAKVIYTKVDENGFNNIVFKEDNNKGRFWDQLIYSGRDPKRGSHLRAGLSYMGNMPSNFRRIPDLNSAELHFKQEINKYRDNQLAQIASISLQLDKRDVEYDKYEENLRYILNRKFNSNNESELRAVSRALRSINENDKADKLELDFAKKYPFSDLSAELLISKISEAESMEQFIEFADFYLKQFPSHSSRDRILSAYSKVYINSQMFDSLMYKFDKIGSISASVYQDIAESMYESNKYSDSLISVVYSKATREKNFKEPYSNKVKFISNKEWMLKLNNEKGRVYESKGFFELAIGDSANAFISFSNAYSTLYSDMNYKGAEKFLQFMSETEILEIKGKDIFKTQELGQLPTIQHAYELSNNFIKADNISDTILIINEKLFNNIYPDGDHQKKLEEMFEFSQNKRRAELKDLMLDGYKEFGIFRKTDGRYVDTEEWTGKAVAIVFWSSWCGPCQAMMPALEDLEAIYVDSIDVEIYGVNVWEDPDNRYQDIDEFLDQNDIKFEILIDESDKYPQKFGVLGLPAVIYLDKEGKLQFIEEGFSSYDDFLRSSIDKLEVLRND